MQLVNNNEHEEGGGMQAIKEGSEGCAVQWTEMVSFSLEVEPHQELRGMCSVGLWELIFTSNKFQIDALTAEEEGQVNRGWR